MEANLLYKNLHFPEDLLLEILSKLPAKSLFMFKCVSKQWLSLISDPSFFFSFAKKSLPFAFISHYNTTKKTHFFAIFNQNAFNSINFQLSLSTISQVKVEATSNDLILLHKHTFPYIIINPFTKKSIQLPMHSRKNHRGPIGFTSRVRNGTMIYKVARITEISDKNAPFDSLSTPNLEIFSSDTGEWKSFNPKYSSKLVVGDFDPRPCVALKGILHWICNKFTTLFAYDPFVDHNKCRFISIPNETYHVNGINAILGVSQETICYFEMNGISIHACKFPEWKLWVLEDYEKGEWKLHNEGKERNVESLGLLSFVLSAHSVLMPIGFHPWNKEVVFFLYEGYVLTFNVMKGWFEEEFSFLSSESLVPTCTIFPLLMPFNPTKIELDACLDM